MESMTKREIYEKMLEIFNDYPKPSDGIYAIAKWVDQSFTYNEVMNEASHFSPIDSPQALQAYFEKMGFAVTVSVEEGIPCAELEMWTNRGVDMIITLNPFTPKSFIDYANEFDVDREIDLHRQDARYREQFSITQSLDDFTQFQTKLVNIATILKMAIEKEATE